MEINIELVREYLECKDGVLYWKKDRGTKIKAGARAGTINKGYIRTIFFGTKIYNHQLSFAMHKGYIPKEIDHLDGDKTNNRIENLRDSSHADNCKNRSIRSDNTSGYKGVSFHSCGKWQVNVSTKYIGLYDTAEDAAMAYNEAATKEFGEYALLNIIK